MTEFKTFLEANYIWFLVISIILVLALVGYISEEVKKKKARIRENDPKYKKIVEENAKAKEELQNMENIAIGDALTNIKEEEKQIKKAKKDNKKEATLEEKEILDKPLIEEEKTESNFEIKR